MLKGVDYEPLIVATQVVAGTNFKFICNATAITNPPKDYLAEIIIFKALFLVKKMVMQQLQVLMY
ncbi:hypothetical protein ACTPDI_01955 [Clostridioides difficile]